MCLIIKIVKFIEFLHFGSAHRMSSLQVNNPATQVGKLSLYIWYLHNTLLIDVEVQLDVLLDYYSFNKLESSSTSHSRASNIVLKP